MVHKHENRQLRPIQPESLRRKKLWSETGMLRRDAVHPHDDSIRQDRHRLVQPPVLLAADHMES
jgi:hypothetical protein